MKKVLYFILILLPAISNAQLDIDGKTNMSAIKTPNEDIRAHTLSFSGSTIAPFGFKYQYCRSFGAYSWFKTDFGALENRYQGTLGMAKSIGRTLNLYLGGGIQIGDFDYHWDNFVREGINLILESGILIKIEKYSLELGVGMVEEKHYYGIDNSINEAQFFLSLGIGYNF